MTTTSLSSKDTVIKNIYKESRYGAHTTVVGNYFLVSDDNLEKLVDKLIEEKLKEFSKKGPESREVKDELAQKEIESFILKNKRMGILKMSILDMVVGLKLPSEQIEKIMKKFEKKKTVTKILL